MVVATVGAVACSASVKDKGGASAAAVSTGTVAAPPAPARSGVHAAPREPTVLFVGTSLTAGLGLDPSQAYPELVARAARRAGVPIHVVNAGVSGETSAGARQRIGWVLRATPAQIVVIETGANDGLRALPLAAARANLAAIVDSVRAIDPAARTALVQMEAPPNLGLAYTTAFHAMYGSVARQKRVTLLPFLLGGVAGIDTLNQADGVHPNVRGERIVAATVWRALEPLVRAAVAAGGFAAAPASRYP